MSFDRWRTLNESMPIRTELSADDVPPQSVWHGVPRPARAHYEWRQILIPGTILTLFGTLVLVSLTSEDERDIRANWPVVLLASILAILGIAILIACTRAGILTGYYPASGEDIAMVDDSDEDCWLVELLVKDADGIFTKGFDHGVVGFAHGAMHFAGNACSFVLGPQDADWPVLRYGTWFRSIGSDAPHRRPGESWQPRLLISLGQRRKQAELTFYVLARPRRTPQADAEALFQAWKCFAAGDPYQGPRSYPPLTAPPES